MFIVGIYYIILRKIILIIEIYFICIDNKYDKKSYLLNTVIITIILRKHLNLVKLLTCDSHSEIV